MEYNILKEKNPNLFPRRVNEKGDKPFHFINDSGKNSVGKMIKVDGRSVDPGGMD